LAVPGSDVLPLAPAVYALEMIITKGGGWTLGLAVTTTTGTAADLTGTTAKITFQDGVVWTAATTGNLYSFDMNKAAVDAVAWQSGTATLTVSDGTHTTVWAKGRVVVQ
jgi:hypothetical protein